MFSQSIKLHVQLVYASESLSWQRAILIREITSNGLAHDMPDSVLLARVNPIGAPTMHSVREPTVNFLRTFKLIDCSHQLTRSSPDHSRAQKD